MSVSGKVEESVGLKDESKPAQKLLAGDRKRSLSRYRMGSPRQEIGWGTSLECCCFKKTNSYINLAGLGLQVTPGQYSSLAEV